MSVVNKRLRRFESILRPFLDIAQLDMRRAPRFPTHEESRGHSLLAANLSHIQPSREGGTTLSRGVLFGAGGSMSIGRIRHFSDRNFVAAPTSSFAQVGDMRREIQTRRLAHRPEISQKRSMLDVLLRR